ncbi:putative splicing factor 3A subunit 1 [Glycine max]|uniref:pre-mRNA-splicing factor sap114-like n=1 Tax=Glycine max TaxID=3847 RepID=UPI00023BFAE5|nr:pre-mRNA-splicing factor sap114-like [Glycine max]KAH1112044.1 hypothetical protein GYH30_010405 [Glycine max]KAH1254996.1 putative splicing factor 3A subunit 1 [Glycine max]|eukprot:XP_006579315.1 pre-mRNA-splicing factor sap114-like [Glycine max]
MIGIIHPPPNIRTIVDKTSQFVAKNGPEFEKRIIAYNTGNAKFNFLNSSDPYHAYYQPMPVARRHLLPSHRHGYRREPPLRLPLRPLSRRSLPHRLPNRPQPHHQPHQLHPLRRRCCGVTQPRHPRPLPEQPRGPHLGLPRRNGHAPAPRPLRLGPLRRHSGEPRCPLPPQNPQACQQPPHRNNTLFPRQPHFVKTPSIYKNYVK